MSDSSIGRSELEVLLAIRRQPNFEGYGPRIANALEEVGIRRPSVGALHTTLERLRKKGFLEARMSEPTPERGGRRKKIYRITGDGQRIALDAIARLRALEDRRYTSGESEPQVT